MSGLPDRPVAAIACWQFDSEAQPSLLHFDQFAVPAGVTWVGGGEGRGKTTLLKILGGASLTSPKCAITLPGKPVELPATGFRPHVAWFDPLTTAFEDHTAAQCWAQASAHFPLWDAALLEQMNDRLGLLPHTGKSLFMLSTGTKRKVWLAAALASGATVTLLDMPFAALDKPSVTYLLGWLKKASGQVGRAWVIADYVAPVGVPLAASIDLGD